jgi:putative ABC transport system ATP-binding protein
MGDVVARASSVTKRFEEGAHSRVVLDGVDMEVRAGELLAILGASGSGKSTLLGLLGGLDRTYGGHVEVLGMDLADLGDTALSKLRGARIGFVFQAFHLLPHLSVLDNVLAPTLFASAVPEDADRRAVNLLKRLGLEGREGEAISHLSGGQRQRAAIARALLFKPALLLCDEPTGNLDAKTGEAIVELFMQLAHEEGVAVVAATHSELLAGHADRVVRLADGKVS